MFVSNVVGDVVDALSKLGDKELDTGTRLLTGSDNDDGGVTGDELGNIVGTIVGNIAGWLFDTTVGWDPKISDVESTGIELKS
jgi:hypothetical protein